MKKFICFIYALICYLIFFATFLYLIGFVQNVTQFSLAKEFAALFAKTMDFGIPTVGIWPAVSINLGLIVLFGLLHSVVASPGFKEKWTIIVRKPLERSTYVLFVSIVLIVLFYVWQPLKSGIWDVSDSSTSTLFTALSLLGWELILISLFVINHFDLFGMRRVYLYGKNDTASKKVEFRTPALYKMVRHPLYLVFVNTLDYLSYTVQEQAMHLAGRSGLRSLKNQGIYMSK